MNRREFEMLAEAMNEAKPDVWIGPRGGTSAHDRIRLNQWRNDVEALTTILSRRNPRFDKDLFVRVCEGEE